MKAGTVIEKINGQAITPETDYLTLLNDKANKKTLVSLYNPQNGERWEEVVIPVGNGTLNNLLYKRWVKQRAADVDKWSNGRLGYVHIQSMGDGSFRSVYSDILGKYNNREGIVIDTRFNGWWPPSRRYRSIVQRQEVFHSGCSRTRSMRYAQPPMEQTIYHADM